MFTLRHLTNRFLKFDGQFSDRFFELVIFLFQTLSRMIHSAAFKQFCPIRQKLVTPFVIHVLSNAVFAAQLADAASSLQTFQHDCQLLLVYPLFLYAHW